LLTNYKYFVIHKRYVPSNQDSIPRAVYHVMNRINNYDNPDWTILDVRSEAEYNGEVNHGNKRVGHIPGATHLEWKILLENSKDPDAVPIFRPAEEIQSILDEADIKKDNTNVTHCCSICI